MTSALQSAAQWSSRARQHGDVATQHHVRAREHLRAMRLRDAVREHEAERRAADCARMARAMGDLWGAVAQMGERR
jgi:hypothetical protein